MDASAPGEDAGMDASAPGEDAGMDASAPGEEHAGTHALREGVVRL